MKIALTNNEKSIDQLIGNIGTKVAADQLLKFNPHLKDLSSLPAGTPVVVPDDGTANSAILPTQLSSAADALQNAIAVTQAAFDAHVNNQVAQAAETRRSFDTKSINDAAAKNPDVAARVNDLRGRIDATTANATSLRSAFADAGKKVSDSVRDIAATPQQPSGGGTTTPDTPPPPPRPRPSRPPR
jgi:hypothetical protein